MHGSPDGVRTHATKVCFRGVRVAGTGRGCVKTSSLTFCIIVDYIGNIDVDGARGWGEDQAQITLLPECLDDYIAEDNAVRVVDVFVDELELGVLGFDGIDPAATRRPAVAAEDLHLRTTVRLNRE